MKDLKVKNISEESHRDIKVEAASRMLSMKDLILLSIKYVTDNKIELD